MIPLEVETDGTNDFGPCECCGNMSRTVRGYLHQGDVVVAAYYVSWTLGRPDHGAHFDLIIGKWGDRSTAQDRYGISLAHRLMPNGSGFMIVDAGGRTAADSKLVGRAMRREEVVGTPLAKQAFALVDAIADQDRRIAEVLGG
jgi:hypothetical protein